MILAVKANDNIIEGGEQSRKMSLTKHGEAHIIRMLTRAYSDKIGSIVREALANSVDSHRMANNPNPVIARLRSDDTGAYFFEAEDEGLGLDKEEFDQYIMGIGESTKRDRDDVIGGLN